MKTLALINEIKDIKEILTKSLQFVKGDTLEVMFVHEEEFFELPDLFKPKYESDDNIDKDEVKKEIQKVLQELKYQEDVAIFVYFNDTYSHVEATQKEINPLIVTKYNESTAKLLESDFKILYLKKDSKEYKNIAVVVNLDDADSRNIDFARENFKDANITLIYDYIHIVTLETADVDPVLGPGYDPVVDEEVKSSRQNAFEELKNSYKLPGVFLDDYNIDDNLIFYVNSNHDLDLLISPLRDTDTLKKVKTDCLSLI